MTDVWAGIVRVSFVGDRSGDSFHADQEQIDDIEHAVRSMKNARLNILPPELDVSGGLTLEQRPSLLAAIEGVERGEYAGIIVSYLSRLGRNVREQLRAWDRVEAAGGRIIVVRENIDTSTPHGRMQRTILLAIAENEREQHAERFEDRARLATAAGIWQRRQTPTGYTRDAQSRRLVPDERADEVRRAFRDRAAGVPVVQIADRLGMTASGVRQMLKNRVYLGELRVRSYVNTAAHDALVTVEQFEAVQGQPRPPRAKGEGIALLAGLVRCEACGHVMTRSGPGDHRSYVCFGRSSGGQCPAAAAIGANGLERHVTALALEELDRLQVTSADADTGVDEAGDRLGAAERELAAYLEAVSVEDVGAEAFAAGARSRRQAVDEARDGLRRRMAVRPAAPAFGVPGELWDGLDAHGRNALLRGLLEAVVVRRAGGRGVRAPVASRVRVVAFGAGLDLVERRAGAAAGIRPLRFDNLDPEYVLGMLGAEKTL